MSQFAVRLAVLIGLVLAITSRGASADKRIAITFDDAPRGAGALMPAEQRTRMLIDALAAADVEGAMFFSTGKNLDNRGSEGEARLRQYVEAGHTLANHSYAHGSADGMPADAFIADVERAHEQLRDFDGYQPWFRFPFLNEGGSIERRDAIRAGLTRLGLEQGYVTVDNYDWYLQALFDEAVNSKQPVNIDGWRDLYVKVLLEAVAFYDQIAIDTLGRSPAHTLLLHENDLAALFIDDLCAALRERGWEIIPATEAYQDPLSGDLPDTLFLGQGRVAALARAAGTSPRQLVHPWESQSALRALAVDAGLAALATGAYLDQPTPGITPEKFAPGVLSLPGRYEYGLNASADGRELFFAVANEDHRGEIHQMRWEDGAWSNAEPILVHPTYSFADPYLSRDGTRLYFISSRPKPGTDFVGQYDIWYATRLRDGWSEPRQIEGTVNTDNNEYYVSFTDDGTLAFASNILSESDSDYDIFLAELENGAYTQPRKLTGRANTKAYEADPFIAYDSSYVLYSTTRRYGAGMRDIFISFREPDGSWSRGFMLGNGINTDKLEFCPSVTRDGRFLFYTSNEDIYWVDAAVIELARERWRAGDD
ncbi:MAG: polysaccharide deacetylase family protein [Pseudomonadota bacterium]